jgi:hypothetical protein
VGGAAELCDQAMGLFTQGHAAAATALLRQAYRLDPGEQGLLVNLGFTLMQQGLADAAARCYGLALHGPDVVVRRSAHKNLGLLRLWQGRWAEGWHHYLQRHSGHAFAEGTWRGDPLNGQTLTVWNDLGMGDAFHFVRYTLPLLQRGERLRLAVHRSQIAVFEQHLAWPLEAVIDRDQFDLMAGPMIPLIHLAALLDAELHWGHSFAGPTWTGVGPKPAGAVGLCWASNPADPTMAPYKSTTAQRLLQLTGEARVLSLQTDDADTHRRLGLDPPSRDWVATLQRIGSCSRVLSVDTAVAHLAAGAGVPVQLLLGAVPDWRWRHGGPSPWYPSLRLDPAGLAAAAG